MNIEEIKSGIQKIAEEFELSLVILYGSYAIGKEKAGSDIDIAVLGKKFLPFEKLIDISDRIVDLFKINEVDVKSLHNVSPLFRYQVAQKGILLYGAHRDYISFKAYAFRDFIESRDLLRLKEILIKKRLQKI